MARLQFMAWLTVAAVTVTVIATPTVAAGGPVCVENANVGDLQEAVRTGQTTTAQLVRAYTARIEAFDRAGPGLNAVRELNPDAPAIAAAVDALASRDAAAALDAAASRTTTNARRPLEGISVLLKDNIATGDAQHTTAGSLALADAYAQRDATVVRLLREAGAVILGKTNLTEFANILAVDMPPGYSSLGGQVKNPFAPELDASGVPIVSPGGSSSGSAVAVAAGFATVAIGTETSGSLLSPASQNGVVTVKPTVGLISRTGILPITFSQDTAGPLTRTVRDAAILLNVLAVPDPLDDATRDLKRPADYTSVLDRDGLRGARIGIPSDPADRANDVYYGPMSLRASTVMRDAFAALEAAGATLVHANLPTIGWMGGPGTEMPVLNLNPESPTVYQPEPLPIVYLYELKPSLNAYLRDWVKGTSIRTMADIIAFNAANAARALRFGQDTFLASEASEGIEAIEYIAARRMDIRAARTRGIDAYMDEHNLDAILFPSNFGAAIAAKAGYPSVQVPAGMVVGVGSRGTFETPFGATFTGRAWSEPLLLRLAYAFEQAMQARRMPPGLPPLDPACVANSNPAAAGDP